MKIYILLFTLLFSFASSQKVNYEISFCGRTQKVILTSKNNKRYSGKIESSFFKRKSGRKILKKKKINKLIAEKLFQKITFLGIKQEKKLKDSAECGDIYLDGDYLSFRTTINGNELIQTVYSEIYPEAESRIEINSCRRNAQIIITEIDKELNLKTKFNKQFARMPINTCYWTGISMVCKGKKIIKSKIK